MSCYEMELKYIKNESRILKNRIRELVDENERLGEVARKGILTGILKLSEEIEMLKINHARKVRTKQTIKKIRELLSNLKIGV